MNELIQMADKLVVATGQAMDYARLAGESEQSLRILAAKYEQAKAEYERLCHEFGEPLYATYNA